MVGPERPEIDATVRRIVDTCREDDRVVAAFLCGSRARREADAFSDVDVGLILDDATYMDVVADKASLARRLGDALFVEDFGDQDVAFVIFADGVELELLFFRASDVPSIAVGPHRVLYDETRILDAIEFPLHDVDVDAQRDELRRVLFWFWHDVGHLTAALGRDHLWWANGQLEQLRHACVTLARIEQGVAAEDEPYWKLDVEISTDPLEPIWSTFVPIERDALLDAGRKAVAFFRERAPAAAEAHGIEYPGQLAELMTGRLEALASGRRA
jgi:predicted nucleotidyltransferase